MQVLVALTASLLLLSAIVHLSGTADAIAQGLNTPPTTFSIHMEAAPHASSPPDEPTHSKVLQQVYASLGIDIHQSDRSDGSVHVAIAYDGKTIEDGSYVPMLKASNAPNVTVTTDKDQGVYYTWILIDIDAPRPSNPSHSPFLHYIVANLDPTGNASPIVVVSHYPVSPPIGNHRYIGLLFAQRALADASALSGYDARFNENRGNFKVNEYVDRQELTYTTRSYFYSRPAHATNA